MAAITYQDLDTILALQLTIGWAGEKAAEPQRLGWWDTDLTDEMAGGDLFSRLLPKTAAWAGLELARQAALRADHSARAKLANPDTVWTLFHFGFELDEEIQDRLEHHRRHAHLPGDVFGQHWGVADSWNQKRFEGFLAKLGTCKVEETPAGRKARNLLASPAEAACSLASALLPLGSAYSLPHAAVKAA